MEKKRLFSALMFAVLLFTATISLNAKNLSAIDGADTLTEADNSPYLIVDNCVIDTSYYDYGVYNGITAIVRVSEKFDSYKWINIADTSLSQEKLEELFAKQNPLSKDSVLRINAGQMVKMNEGFSYCSFAVELTDSNEEKTYLKCAVNKSAVIFDEFSHQSAGCSPVYYWFLNDVYPINPDYIIVQHKIVFKDEKFAVFEYDTTTNQWFVAEESQVEDYWSNNMNFNSQNGIVEFYYYKWAKMYWYVTVMNVNDSSLCTHATSAECCPGGGLQDAENVSSVQIKTYPKPAKDELNVDINNLTSQAEIVITDMNGRNLYTEKVSAGAKSMKLNIDFLPCAMYNVILKTDKTIAQDRFIKQ